MNFVENNNVCLIVKFYNKINAFYKNADRFDFQFIKFIIFH